MEQWPATAAARAQLSTYLVSPDELALNAIEIADTFSAGLRSVVDEKAGLVTFAGTTIVCASDLRPPAVLYSAQLVMLTLSVLLSEYHPGFATALAYSRLSTPARDFWLDIYDRLSWQSTPSKLFVVALAIQRADIQAFVRMAHQRMALLLESNRRIDKALTLLCGIGPRRRPWAVRVDTPLFERLRRIIGAAQIPVAALSDDTDCDLIINGVSRVRMAMRDRIFIATLLLYHAAGELMGADYTPWSACLPRSAPDAFHLCAAEYPELFSQSVTPSA